ncbi:MAG: ATP-binding protein [Pseudomonadota bacterium]
MERVQKQHILKDLDKKMVFVAGPRQAGKTWLAKEIAKHFEHSVYLNYDQIEHREIIKNQEWRDTTDLIVFDELHKMPEWKNYLKGVYDTKPANIRILVTGSARLDIYSRVGDSLAGRYFLHHLLPLSLSELNQLGESASLNHLLKRGGFPEPFLLPTDLDAERWRDQYINSLLSTDIFEIDNVRNINAIQLVFKLLRHCVGSPVSYQSLAEDVGVAINTIKKYIEILEALYVIFRVIPYSKNIARSILKEPKIYFFDTGLVNGDEGIKLENLTAVSLLKHALAKRDYLAEHYNLSYLRTREKQEVDFALVKDESIEKIIEVKLSASDINKSLFYFHKKYHLPAIQIVKNLKIERKKEGIEIIKADAFLKDLYL